MQPTPPGWPRFSSSIVYRDAAAAIDWLCRAFGFEVRLRVDGDDGRVVHAELEYGDGLICLAQQEDGSPRAWKRALQAPAALGGANTQCIMFYVDDATAHCERARTAGAVIVEEPAVHDYGDDHWADRSYGALDPEGHLWWVTQRLRNPPAR